MTEVNQLAEQLRNGALEARIDAAEELASLGEDAQNAALSLIECLETGDDPLQEWAVAALEQLGPPNVADMEALTSLLERDHELVGYWACTLLGRLEGEATAATPALAKTLQTSQHLAVQQRAAWALGKIPYSDASVTQALQDASQSDDARLSRLAQQAIDSKTSL